MFQFILSLIYIQHVFAHVASYSIAQFFTLLIKPVVTQWLKFDHNLYPTTAKLNGGSDFDRLYMNVCLFICSLIAPKLLIKTHQIRYR